MKTYGKQNNRYAAKKKSNNSNNPTEGPDPASALIQSKLVLLTLTFPRVRIIWSSSPYFTAQMFNDLKLDRADPDAAKAVSIGAEEDANAGAGVNASAEELLRCLPGITAKNVGYVMGRVRCVRELCEMDLRGVQELLGAEPGKRCWDFIHKGDRRR